MSWIWLNWHCFFVFIPEPSHCALSYASIPHCSLSQQDAALFHSVPVCVWCQWALGLGRCTRQWRALVEVINQSWHLHGNGQSWRAHLSNNSVPQKAIVQYADSNLHNIFARANITTLYIGAECNGIIRPNSSMAIWDLFNKPFKPEFNFKSQAYNISVMSDMETCHLPSQNGTHRELSCVNVVYEMFCLPNVNLAFTIALTLSALALCS